MGFDGSDHARDGLALAQLLARSTGAQLIAACVWESIGEPSHPAFGEWRALVREEARKVADEARSIAGDNVEVRGCLSTSPARGLHDLAEEEDAGLIVAGSSHRGRVGTVMAGTTGLSLLHRSPCAVAVAPAGFRDVENPAIRVIGIGYDGRAESEVALAGAIDLARSTGARLRILTVAGAPNAGYEQGEFTYAGTRLAAGIAQQMREDLDEALMRIPHDVEADTVLITRADETLADQEGLDLLVIGSRAWGPLRRVLLGSVASRLVRSAPCPLIVFPRGADAPERSDPTTARAAGAPGL